MKQSIFVIAMIIGGSFYCRGQEFQSSHFSIQRLADGVFAAIAKKGGYAICNAGIIDLGDAVLIMDPFMSPQAARELKNAAEQLTGHPVKYVVNSHFHNDHIGGNQVFDQASIISTTKTKKLIEKNHPEEIARHKISAPSQLEKLKNTNLSGMTPHELDEHSMWKGYYEALVYSVDSLKTISPDLTFDKEKKIYGTKRSVQLLTFGTGHTESDLLLFLPKEKIAFTGDLLFINNHPWLGDGNTEKWKIYLDSIAALKVKILVPGHGPIGNKNNLDTMKRYFDAINDEAILCHKKGVLPQSDASLKPSAPFKNWFLSVFFRPNVMGAYNRMYNK